MRHALLPALVLGLSAITGHAAQERPPAGSAVATCSRQLMVIGEALAAFQRDHGEFPVHLSVLAPQYLPGRMLLHCPTDPTPGSPGFQGAAAEAGLACSYSYEMSTDATAVRCFMLGPRPAAMTWRAQKLAQQLHFGDRVPVLRCGHHRASDEPRARLVFLNLTRSGEVYRSQARWEFEPETLPAVLTNLERDLDQKGEEFGRRWRPDRLAEYLRAVPPAPAYRAQCKKVAGKLAALAFASPYTAAYSLSNAVEDLFRVSGDLKSARLWRRRWTGGLLAPVSTT